MAKKPIMLPPHLRDAFEAAKTIGIKRMYESSAPDALTASTYCSYELIENGVYGGTVTFTGPDWQTSALYKYDPVKDVWWIYKDGAD
ncbi:hypothetical protein D3C76_887210 [compost metagenome]